MPTGRLWSYLEHGLPHALLLVFFDVSAGHSERTLVEVDCRVEVGHSDADVVNAQQADRCDMVPSQVGAHAG